MLVASCRVAEEELFFLSRNENENAAARPQDASQGKGPREKKGKKSCRAQGRLTYNISPMPTWKGRGIRMASAVDDVYYRCFLYENEEHGCRSRVEVRLAQIGRQSRCTVRDCVVDSVR